MSERSRNREQRRRRVESPRTRTAATGVALLLLLAFATPLLAQPTLVPVAEGQLGEPPVFVTRIFGAGFQPLGGGSSEWLTARRTLLDLIDPSSAVFFEVDTVHDAERPSRSPMPLLHKGMGAALLGADSDSGRSNGDSDSRRGGGGSEGAGSGLNVFAHHQPGSAAGTLRFVVNTFDGSGVLLSTFTTADIASVIPDAGLRDSDVTINRQGRVTLVYGSFDGTVPLVFAQRIDGVTGTALGGAILVGPGLDPEIDSLDPAGNRLFVVYSQSTVVIGNILDLSGASPVVGAPFGISTTPVIAIERPTVVTDSDTGAVAVAWDALADNPGDPVNVRARRFDGNGDPISSDFVAHVITANAQAQASMDFGPNGELAFAFAGDSATVIDALDVFLRVFDANGTPIANEIVAHTITAAIQDRPTVRFVSPDSQGRPQIAVVWRDVGAADGSSPRGSGIGYRCFVIDGLPTNALPFADGFESGDTSAWSQTVP